MDTLQAEALLHCLPYPTLILSDAKVVLAANRATQKLTGLRSAAAVKNSIIGCPLLDLGFALLPMRKPVYPSWESLFAAALAEIDPEVTPSGGAHPEGLQNPTGSGEGNGGNNGSLWNDEVFSDYLTVEVLIPRILSRNESGLVKDAKRIRARMTVQATKSASVLLYVITFQPPREITPITKRSDEERANFLLKQSSNGSSPTSDHDISDQRVHNVISTLIPHVMALLDHQGQVLFLSKSWYDFTGLTEAQSLGTAWAEAIHPDDVESIIASWSAVLSEGREHGTWEARYRKRDGTYTYFLIRARPYRDESGQIRQWYASMLDVNELVLARLESEHRRKTIEMLLSQADVSL